MPVNKAENTLENRLINDIDSIKRDLREIKGVQPVGADILAVASSDLTEASFTVTAGGARTAVITITPTDDTLTLWNFAFSNYMDVDNQTYLYPDGIAWAPGEDPLKMRIWGWFDWADSNDITNTRVFKIRYDASSCASDHTVYLKFKSYLPRLAGTTV